MQTNQHQKAFEQLGSALAFNSSHTGAILAAGSMMQVLKARYFTEGVWRHLWAPRISAHFSP